MTLEELKAATLKQRTAKQADERATNAAKAAAVQEEARAAIMQHVDPLLLSAGTLMDFRIATFAFSKERDATCYLCIDGHMPLKLKVSLTHFKPERPYLATYWSPLVPSENNREPLACCMNVENNCWGYGDRATVNIGALLLDAETKLRELRTARQYMKRCKPEDHHPANTWLNMQIFDVPIGATPRRVLVEVEVPAIGDDTAKLIVLQAVDKVRTIFSVKRCEIA